MRLEMRALRFVFAASVLLVTTRARAQSATAPAPGRAATRPAATAPAAKSAAAAPAPKPAAPVVKPVTEPTAGLIHDPAPRPAPALRIQSRYAQKAGRPLLYGGVEYLARGDFFISPGARLGFAYYVLEPLALEAQVSHYWSSLNDEAQRIRQMLGAIPDSHAPGWLMLAGARYSIGYGKLLVGGMGTAIHLEPQAFLHLGGHVHDGDTGFSSDAGLGLLVYLTPDLFTRIDVALVFEREQRSGVPVSVWGALPALSIGGLL
jgi:hypothetical protein